MHFKPYSVDGFKYFLDIFFGGFMIRGSISFASIVIVSALIISGCTTAPPQPAPTPTAMPNSFIVLVNVTMNLIIPYTGQSYTLTAHALGGNPPYSYYWNFGDGTTATGNPVTHVYHGSIRYAKPCYIANVTVSDSSHKTAIASVKLKGFGGFWCLL